MRILDFADGFESAVAPESVDYPATAIEVTPVGNLGSDTAQEAFEELQGDIDDLNDMIGSADGIASLDSSGKIPTAQIPALALVDVYSVADIAARDALTVQEGDVAVVANAGGGVSKTYIYNGSSWIELLADGSLASHIATTTGIHGVSGNLVGTSDTQQLTNKDYDGGTASNARRITIPKDTLSNLTALSRKEGTVVYATDQGKLYFDNGSTLTAVGSGSGSGGINHIGNPDAETDTTGYATYADAAGTSPVDGTGGSPNVTWTRSTSNPLRGLASFLLTKDAANRQGEGASYAFSIADADKAKVHTVSFSYEIGSGTYADDDLTIWIYDVTNSILIQPTAYQVKNVGIESKHVATFQTASNSTSYRLIVHVSSTSASAYTVKFDDVSVSPQLIVQGTPVKDWESYTPTFTGFGTPSGVECFWARDGADLLLRCKWTSGTSTATEARVSLPNGLTAAGIAVIPSISVAGPAAYSTGTAGSFFALMEHSVAYVTLGMQTAGAGGLSKANGNAILASGDKLSFTARIPIAGWSSNVVMSDSADTRVVAAKFTATSLTTSIPNTATFTVLDFPTSVFDTHGAVTTGASWKYTVKVPGKYRVRAQFLTGGESWTAANNIQMRLFKNGSDNSSMWVYFIPPATGGSTQIGGFGEAMVDLVAGDYVDVRISHNRTGGSVTALESSAIFNSIDIQKISGPAQIAASETIAARYTTAAGANLVTGTIIDFATKDYDTHGSVTVGASWKFTAPISGLYEIDVALGTAAATAGAIGNLTGAQLSKNAGGGTAYLALEAAKTTSSVSKYPRGSTKVRLMAGETVSILGLNSTGSAHALQADANVNFIEITKVGNY